MEQLGFWAKDEEYIDITTSKHIWEILKQPERFGLSTDLVTSEYEKYNEKAGMEGKARIELIKRATLNGWIRVRQYSNPEYWSIQFDDWERRKASILKFLQWAISQSILNLSEEVVLTGVSDNTDLRYGFIDGGVNKFFFKKIIWIIVDKNLVNHYSPIIRSSQ